MLVTPPTIAKLLLRPRRWAKWRENYLAGSVAQRKEFAELTTLAASGNEAPDHLLIETVDSVSDPNALPKAGYAALIDGLREQGLPTSSEQYIRELDAGLHNTRPSEGDGAAARIARDRLTRDPEFAKRYLNGDVAATNIVNALNRWISFAADDGKPISPEGQEWLTSIGLR